MQEKKITVQIPNGLHLRPQRSFARWQAHMHRILYLTAAAENLMQRVCSEC